MRLLVFIIYCTSCACAVATHINSSRSQVADCLHVPHMNEFDKFDIVALICVALFDRFPFNPLLPATSDSFPVQGLPRSACAGLLELGCCSCLCVSVSLQTKPRPEQLSPAGDTKA